MGLEWETRSIRNGETVEFKFQDNITSYFSGINGFKAAYEGENHHVKKFGVKLDTTKTSEKTISVTLHIILHDSSGHSAPVEHNWAFVSVVAWLGSGSPCELENVKDLCSRTHEQRLGGTAVFTGAALNSFVVGYEGEDHAVQRVYVYVGAEAKNEELKVEGSASIADTSGNTGVCSDLSACVITSLIQDPRFAIKKVSFNHAYTDKARNNIPVTTTFEDPSAKKHDDQLPSTNITDALALITTFTLAYGDQDHDIKKIKGGAMEYNAERDTYAVFTRCDGDKVTIPTNFCMFDSTGHQSNTNAATLLVIAKFKDLDPARTG